MHVSENESCFGIRNVVKINCDDWSLDSLGFGWEKSAGLKSQTWPIFVEATSRILNFGSQK